MSEKDTKRKVQEALAEKRRQLKELQENRLANQQAAAAQAAPPPTPAAPAAAVTSKSELDNLLNDINDLVPSKQESKAPSHTSPTLAATPTTGNDIHIRSPMPHSKRKYNLTFVLNQCVNDIPPRETPTYSKSTQTDVQTIEDESLKQPAATQQRSRARYKHTKDEEEGENQVSGTENAAGTTTTEAEESVEKEVTPVLKELSLEEKSTIMESTGFKDFIDRSAHIVDRALFMAESLDIMQDYKSEDKQESQAATREATLKATLFDERWSKHRSITDLAWSTKHPELILAAYSANEAGSQDPDGVVQIWNVNNFFQKPEFVFNCQSPVMTAQFSKFHSTMVIGGTYSGQLVLWDTRAKSMPVQRTPLSAVGHTHPVYSLCIVGSANAHNLVSVSTDGRLCVWSLENLSHPSETLELNNKLNKPVTAPVAVTSLSFPDGEVNSFLVGSEEGAVFQGYRHGTTSGITERYDGHFGPITATDFHPARGNIDFSHLFLSSSTDWTCKLWSTKHGSRSIYSFEDATDYVYDARWSPTHPAVFATADGSGFLDVWDANEDTEVPIIKARSSSRALNRIVWGADGKRIIAGDAAGHVFLYDVGDVAVPDANEWNRFEEVLLQLGAAKGPARPQDDDNPTTPRDADDMP